METSDAREVIQNYLEDAIAAEKSFETQLRGFAKDAQEPDIRQLFEQHAEETRGQWEALTDRLRELGGSPSGVKSFLAHLFNVAPTVAQAAVDHQPERAAQNLMIAFAVENSEVAMYEALATVASAAGDGPTEILARRIQNQERATAEKVWHRIAPAAKQAMQVRAAA